MIARFIPAISSGSWIPHRIRMSWPNGPHHYVMREGRKGSASPISPTLPRNHHRIGVLSNPEPGTIVETSKETTLDLQIQFPRGFPRGSVHPTVTSILSGASLDAEARVLVELSKKSSGEFGLTVREDLITMRVKNPLIDCYYGFTWLPPKPDAYARWVGRFLANGRGRAAKFVS